MKLLQLNSNIYNISSSNEDWKISIKRIDLFMVHTIDL